MSGIFWLDPTSGAYAQGTAEPYADNGEPGLKVLAAGLTYSVSADHYFATPDELFTIYGAAVVTPTATYLRQRQSPVRTPSRIRPPQLRQRQRPEVIT